MTKNERNTENLVRDSLREFDYYDDSNDVQVEEQKSHIDAAKRLLKAASKSGGGGKGSPEFIISSPSEPDFIIIVECKASPNDHCSDIFNDVLAGMPVDETSAQTKKRVQRFPADGVIHYARSLSREFNVIAVAASGETKPALSISAYLFGKGQAEPQVLKTRAGKAIEELIPWSDFIGHAVFDPAVQKVRYDELMAFSRELHDFMRDHAKLTESEKPLMVSGTLIALRNKAFAKAYDEYGPEELQKQWMRVIKDEIQKADIPRAKKANMAQPYSSIAVHPELSKATKNWPRGVLHELIRRLKEKVWPFISVYQEFDTARRHAKWLPGRSCP